MKNLRRLILPRWSFLVLLVAMCSCGTNPPMPPRRSVFQVNSETGKSYELVGDLYLPARSNGIGVVFLHGSSPFGRKLHLYPSLAAELQSKGYAILLLDQRGYGESDNPDPVSSLAEYTFLDDAVAGVSFLESEMEGALKHMILAGHSKGGGVAMTAALRTPEVVDGIICISPGRRFDEVFSKGKHSPGVEYLQKRKSGDMKLPELIPADVLVSVIQMYEVSQWRGHHLDDPLLYVEGEREPEKDLRFSQKLISDLHGPVVHKRIPEADHYFGTSIVRDEDGKRWQTTNQEVLDELVFTLDEWMQSLE